MDCELYFDGVLCVEHTIRMQYVDMHDLYAWLYGPEYTVDTTNDISINLSWR